MTALYYVIQQVGDVTFRVGDGHETEGQALLAQADMAAGADEDLDLFVDGPDTDAFDLV